LPRLITAGRVLLGDGTSIDAAGVVVANGRIERVAPIELLADERYDEIDSFPNGCLVPGFIDAHVHLCFDYKGGLNVDPEQLVESELMTSLSLHCRGLVNAGVTSVCDLGSVGDIVQRVRDAINQGDLEGPRIICAGRPITTIDGHLRSFGLLASDEESLAASVAALFADGVDVVKVVATGGASTPGTAMGLAQFTTRELQVVVRTSASVGLLVAAHAHGTEGIRRAVEAGVHTVQHCTWLNDDGTTGPMEPNVLDEMARCQQIAVIAGPLPEEIVGRLTAHEPPSPNEVIAFGFEEQRQLTFWANALSAREMGVEHALGTDSLFGQFEDYRDLAWRAQGLVELAGWPEALVLETLWQGGARALGMPGEIGTVSAGAHADLVLLGADPRSDIRALHDVRAVYCQGSRYSRF
jgi:imidazolonepropionase-like amidohydrolase